jgi:hypothetical protein
VSGRGCFVVRQFALNPNVDESPLEEVTNFKAELGNSVNPSLKFGVWHGGSIVYPPYG